MVILQVVGGSRHVTLAIISLGMFILRFIDPCQFNRKFMGLSQGVDSIILHCIDFSKLLHQMVIIFTRLRLFEPIVWPIYP